MAEIDKIKRRIHFLLQKTKANGCTEEEAMSAAEKAGELMDQFDLSIGEIAIREVECIEVSVPTPGKNRPTWDSVIVALGTYCDCIVWFSKASRYGSANSSFKAFGMKHDTEIFEWLYGVIRSSIERETEDFKDTEIYTDAQSSGRAKTATTSFQRGMASSISRRLNEMKKDRIRESENTGRSLVVVKDETVRKEFKKTGMRLRTSTRYVSNRHASANSAGYAAGSRVNLNGVGSGGGVAGHLN